MFNMYLAAQVDSYLICSVFEIIFMVLLVLESIAIIVIVMLQKGVENNLGAITGGGESFFGKNKSSSVESKLKRGTMILAGSVLITSIMFFVVEIIKNNL